MTACSLKPVVAVDEIVSLGIKMGGEKRRRREEETRRAKKPGSLQGGELKESRRRTGVQAVKNDQRCIMNVPYLWNESVNTKNMS